MDFKNIIHFIIIKIIYWESRIFGALPIKIEKGKLKISLISKAFCHFWLVLVFLGCLSHIHIWIFEEERNFGDFMFQLAMINMYVYSIGSFFAVCKHSENIIENFNFLIELIIQESFRYKMSSELVLEFVSVNFILIPMDIYCYSQEKMIDLRDWRMLTAAASLYPRRIVFLFTLIAIHFISEILGLLINRLDSENST